MLTFQDVKQYVVFITGGGLGALVKWGISFFLTSLLGMYYMVALLLAELVNVMINYVWHRSITFRVRGSIVRQFSRFFLLSSATVVLSMGLVFVVKEYLLDIQGEITVAGFQLNYLVAIVAVTFAVSIINYCVSRVWVFITDDMYHSSRSVGQPAADDPPAA